MLVPLKKKQTGIAVFLAGGGAGSDITTLFMSMVSVGLCFFGGTEYPSPTFWSSCFMETIDSGSNIFKLVAVSNVFLVMSLYSDVQVYVIHIYNLFCISNELIHIVHVCLKIIYIEILFTLQTASVEFLYV